jgi:hypothetical protein
VVRISGLSAARGILQRKPRPVSLDAKDYQCSLPLTRRPSSRPRFIFSSMDRATTRRACVIAWLLCAVLTCLAIHSPHCDLCDGPLFVPSASHQPLVNLPTPASPDTCNGICSCCGFRALPNVGPVLGLIYTVTASAWPKSSSPVPAPQSTIFRPPRMAISS